MALILVVDGGPENRDLMVTVLRRRGHDVLEASDGVAALRMAEARKLDLIISDVLMPSMDGFELVRQVRERTALADVPVIFRSAHYLSAEVRTLAAARGVWHVLPKPAEPEEVGRITEEVLGAALRNGPSAAKDGAEQGESFEEARCRLLTDQFAAHNAALALANQRLEAEVAIRRHSEARYRAVVDTAADAIVVTDEDGIIQSFNRSAERIFGYAGAEVVGKNLSLLMAEPSRSSHEGFLRRNRTTGEPRVFGLGREVEGRRKGGSAFPLELAVAEWTDSGRRYFTGIMRDVTRRKEAEEALTTATEQAVAARGEAELANLAKSKFLAAVNHDLRQPAQAMALFLPMVVEALKSQPQAAAAHHLEQAFTALSEMLDQLLDVSKLDAGYIAARPGPLSLHEVILPVAQEYSQRVGQQGLRLRLVPSSASVHSDATLLERILRNLLDNALAYTPSGGILIGCRRRGGRVRLDVIDTGIGIALDELPLVFNEFYQVGNPERDRSKGLGLGLAIVKRLSCLLDHPIEIVSRPGKGTRVSLTLPPEAPQLTADQMIPPTVGAGSVPAPVVVVVDDEPLIRSGLGCILEGWGYRVIAAQSGAEAAAAVEAQGICPDLMIADYRLSRGQTGLDAISLVSSRVGHSVPSLVLTGDTASPVVAAVRQAGYLLMQKPLSTTSLRSALAELLGSSS